jgi:hypothetical protein
MCCWLTKLIFLPIFFGNLIEISNNKNNSKFNISPTSSPIFLKLPSLNPTHQGPSKNTKSVSKFPYKFLFWFKWIFGEMFFQYLINFPLEVNIMKPTWCTFTCWGLSNGTKNATRSIAIWEMSIWQTKLGTFLKC